MSHKLLCSVHQQDVVYVGTLSDVHGLICFALTPARLRKKHTMLLLEASWSHASEAACSVSLGAVLRTDLRSA